MACLGEKRQKAQVRHDGAARASAITAANPHHDSRPEPTREREEGREGGEEKGLRKKSNMTSA